MKGGTLLKIAITIAVVFALGCQKQATPRAATKAKSQQPQAVSKPTQPTESLPVSGTQAVATAKASVTPVVARKPVVKKAVSFKIVARKPVVKKAVSFKIVHSCNLQGEVEPCG
jgi:hypothetical protein